MRSLKHLKALRVASDNAYLDFVYGNGNIEVWYKARKDFLDYLRHVLFHTGNISEDGYKKIREATK